jgi:glutamyl-tRNA reductase
LRKNLQAERVHILGGGQLVQEILPYLAKHAEVVVHVRQPEKAQALVGPRVRVESLSASAFDRGALVVAAPLSASAVRDWLAQRTALQIFDLRDSSAADAVSTAAISLQDIFAQIEHTRERLKPVVANVKAEIVRLAHAYVAQEKVRPQGWDDLCA